MGTDHGILCTWRTPDLICRDQQLRAKTAARLWEAIADQYLPRHCSGSVCRNAMNIHIVVLVVTAGMSLPFNLLLGIRHVVNYRKVKHERHSIRQILGKRNVTYTGNGQWMLPQAIMHPGPGPGPWMDPNVGQSLHPNVMHPGPGPGPWMAPNVGQSLHPNVMHPGPGPGPWMAPNVGQPVYPNVMRPDPGPGPCVYPNVGQGVHPNVMHHHHQHWADPNVMHHQYQQWADPNGISSNGTGQWADPNAGNNTNNGNQDQFTQAAQLMFDAASQFLTNNN